MAAAGEELEKRVTDLELRFMRAERLMEQLNDVLVERGREIDRLASEVRTLRQQVLAAEEAVGDERPPHY